MTEPTSPTPPDDVAGARPVAATPIDEDIACARCGYNLRGLRADGLCPECGTPIARSLLGNRLHFADPEWIGKLRLGVALKLWNMLLTVLAGISIVVLARLSSAVGPGFGIGGAPVLVGILGAVLALMAVWCITAPEPNIATSEDPISLRRFIRASAVIGAIGGLANQGLIGGVIPRVVPANVVVRFAVVGGMLALIGIAALFGEFVYLRRFARRLPDQKLVDNTTVVMWGLCLTWAAFGVIGMVSATLIVPRMLAAAAAGGTMQPPRWAIPVFGCFGWVGGIGWLVFSIWYVILLFQYHASFKKTAAESRGLMASANE